MRGSVWWQGGPALAAGGPWSGWGCPASARVFPQGEEHRPESGAGAGPSRAAPACSAQLSVAAAPRGGLLCGRAAGR